MEVRSNMVQQYIRTEVGDVDGRRAARTNVGQWCVPRRFSNAYECRIAADVEHVGM